MLAAQPARTTALLQAVHAVDDSVVWVAGHDATWASTVDGGLHWRVGTVAGAGGLEFRDVWASGPDTAFLLSAGPGDRSRIYATTDGGRSWTLQFTNQDSAAFFDCLDFWDARKGLAFSDAVQESFVLLSTEDGGIHWKSSPPGALPAAHAGEGGFAASGACLTTGPEGRAWIGTGASDLARVLHTDDGGRSWTWSSTPLPGGPQAGVMAVAFRDATHGVAVGGDLASRPDRSAGAGPARTATGDGPPRVALTDDGGGSWTAATSPGFAGPLFGVAWVPGAPTPTLVAVGPGGAGYSVDAGRSWTVLDTLPYWSVDFASPDAGWLVGPEGRIARAGIFGRKR
jgi:photosystem II stability/assembly factor-like uncharacterized protein